MLQKDDEDKENAANGSKPSRSKHSTKSMAPKSLNGDDNFDVFDPENDEQLQQSSKSAKNVVKGKTSRDGEKITECKAVAIAEREKELSKMKVSANSHINMRAWWLPLIFLLSVEKCYFLL